MLSAITAVFMWAQRDRYPLYPPYEVRSLFPSERSAGQYQQVSQREIQALAEEGWELVSVTPYIYRNEERGDPAVLRPIVTQTYPAYFFKRQKILLK